MCVQFDDEDWGEISSVEWNILKCISKQQNVFLFFFLSLNEK